MRAARKHLAQGGIELGAMGVRVLSPSLSADKLCNRYKCVRRLARAGARNRPAVRDDGDPAFARYASKRIRDPVDQMPGRFALPPGLKVSGASIMPSMALPVAR